MSGDDAAAPGAQQPLSCLSLRRRVSGLARRLVAVPRRAVLFAPNSSRICASSQGFSWEPSPSHGENRGSSPLGSASDFDRLIGSQDDRRGGCLLFVYYCCPQDRFSHQAYDTFVEAPNRSQGIHAKTCTCCPPRAKAELLRAGFGIEAQLPNARRMLSSLHSEGELALPEAAALSYRRRSNAAKQSIRGRAISLNFRAAKNPRCVETNRQMHQASAGKAPQAPR